MPNRLLLSTLAVLTAASASAAVTDLSGNLASPLDQVVGAGNSARLTANTTTYWATTTAASNVNFNALQFTIDTGGGNAQVYTGALTGPGTLRLVGRGDATWIPDIRIGGTVANTPASVTITQGRVQLNKTAGANALAGPITVNTSQTVRLQLLTNDQIDDASVIDATASSGAFYLEMGGFNDRIGGLSINTDHRVETGTGGVLTTTALTMDGTLMGAGTYTAASHEFVTGTGSVVVTTGGGSSFDAWATAHELAGAAAAFAADPDGDDLPNGIEFILGSEANPARPDANSSARWPTATSAGDTFVFTFTRSPAAAYLNPVVEISSTLAGPWTTAVDPDNATIEVTPGSVVDTVTVRISRGAHPALFVRLKAVETSQPTVPSPRLTAVPQNTSVLDGGSFTLTAAAGGARQVAWQWHLNGHAIAGASASSYAVTGATSAHVGDYHVVVTNASGSAISGVAHVAITATPGVAGLELIPWPLTVELGTGNLMIPSGARIVATDAALVDAATVLAAEIAATHARTLPVVTTAAADGDIVLALDPLLTGERHTLTVATRATVGGRNAFGVSLGTATLLQALRGKAEALECPRVTVADEPAAGIRALHLDLARENHSLESLLQAVDLCRLYKINFLHLHFNDDQGYSFPTTAFPLLKTVTAGRGRTVYTLAEMQSLETYAVARGVHIMPELEGPGHNALMLAAYPALFKITYPHDPASADPAYPKYEPSSSINIAKAEVRAAIRTLIGEMCAVFQSTPYFHLGCDEVDWAWSEHSADFQAIFAEWGFTRANPHENVYLVFKKFITLARGYAAEWGKQSIVWENGVMTGWPEVTMPTDVLVMPFDSYNPGAFSANGFKLVNAAWSPLYLVTHIRKPVSSIYAWDRTVFGQYSGECDEYVSHTVAAQHVVGTQLTTFEQEEDLEMMSMRIRLAAMSERTWNPALGTDYANFRARLVHTDALLDALLSPVRIAYTGLADPDDRVFSPTATVNMSLTPGAAAQALTIRYTTNRTDVTNTSPLYTGPFKVSANGYLRAAAFTATGQRVGHMVREMHRHEMTLAANLAAGKPVTASTGSDAAKAVDLRDCQGWNTTVSSTRPAGETLTVDLQSGQQVSRIALLFAPSGGYSYRLEISANAAAWTTVASATVAGSRAGITHTFAATLARYVRLTLLPVAGSTGDKSVREIMVTGNATP